MKRINWGKIRNFRNFVFFFISMFLLLQCTAQFSSDQECSTVDKDNSLAGEKYDIPEEDIDFYNEITEEIKKEFPLTSEYISSSGEKKLSAYGVNPSRAEILDYMRVISTKYQVPSEVLFAIGEGESNLMQFRNGQPVISGDDGIGMMQVTPWAISEAFDREALMWDWRYNIEAGAQVILGKWRYVKSRNPIGSMEWNIIENWYLAIWAYNGYSYINNPNEYIYGPRTWSNGYVSWTIAYPYQKKILNYIKEYFAIDVTEISYNLLPGYGTRPGIPYSGQVFNTPSPFHYTLSEVETDFVQISGNLKDIASGGERIWGVNTENNIYYKDSDDWINVPGKLVRITSDDEGNVWGINASQEIYRYDNGNWIKVDGYLTDIGADNGEVWGVNASGNIYRYTGNNNWEQKLATFTGVRIDVDADGDPWVVADDGSLYAFNYSGEWIQISGTLSDIGCGGGVTWGVNPDGKIYRYEGSGVWTNFPVPFYSSSVDVDDNGVAIVTSTNGDVYIYMKTNNGS